jgi:lysozyme
MLSQQEIIQRLSFNEGFKQKPYRCSVNKLTIGVGRNLDDCPLTKEELEFIGHDCREKSITKEQVFYLLRHDIDRAIETLNRKLPWWKNLSDDRQYVLIDLVFNLGINSLLQFKKFLKYLSTGFYKQAARELMDSKYARQVPKRAERNKRAIETGKYTL